MTSSMGEKTHRRRSSLGAFVAMLVVWIFGATDCLADPFGDPVKYPRIPALIIAEVKVDGDSASMSRCQGTSASIWVRNRSRRVTFFLFWYSAWANEICFIG